MSIENLGNFFLFRLEAAPQSGSMHPFYFFPPTATAPPLPNQELRRRWQDELSSEKRQLESQVDKLKKQCLQLKLGAVVNNTTRALEAGHA